MKRLFFIFFILITTVQLYGQTSVNTVVDTNIIEFGNQTKLRIQMQVAENQNIIFPRFKDTIGDGIDFVEEMPLDTISQKPFTLEKTYVIAGFKDSIRTIPALPVLVDTDTVWSSVTKILVQPLYIDSATMAKVDTTHLFKIFDIDINPPMDKKMTFKEFWIRFGRWITLALGIILVLAAIFWFAYRAYKNKPIKILEKPKEPAHLIAFRQLEDLKNKKIFATEKSKEFYSELTGILRLYIEYRFSLPALENTSTEILDNFDQNKELIDNEQFEALRTILETADLAKFAKYKQLQNVNEANFELTYNFVEKTKLVVVEKQIQNENETETETNKNE